MTAPGEGKFKLGRSTVSVYLDTESCLELRRRIPSRTGLSDLDLVKMNHGVCAPAKFALDGNKRVVMCEAFLHRGSDLAEAFESFKLAVLRHKMNGWEEVSREDVLASLEALKQLVLAPSEE